MKPADIARIVTVDGPAVSPDGSSVAYVVRRMDLDSDRYRSAVWLVRPDGGTPRPTEP
ncbi:MAG: hypothetical protein H0V96_11455 [Acidimicrobiia bacterium]|nr:hypothetical protein [Acidimicrobiia bacterium]